MILTPCSLIQKSLVVNFEIKESCLLGSLGHSEGRNLQNARPHGNVHFNVIDKIDNKKLRI